MGRKRVVSFLGLVVAAACGGVSRGDRPSGGGNGGAGSPAAGAPAVASAGAGPSAAGTASASWRGLDGIWAMFDFEDPVTVALTEQAWISDASGEIHQLSGKGSCTPFDTEAPALCGGDLRGERTEKRARFTFPALASDEYVTDAFVSTDASRMSGTYGLNGGSSQTAWVRLQPGQSWLESDDTTLSEAVSTRAGRYDLYFISGDGNSFGASPIPPNVTLRLRGETAMLSGMFGSFWAGEMRWDAVEQTLVVGPVPVTAPTGVVAVRLIFDDAVLTDADATAADGSHYTFTTMPF